MLIVYQYWTPQEVTLIEAWLTFLYFPLLVGVAYLLDARPWQRRSGDVSGGAQSTHAYQV
jgi:solute carrier family 8 (sodium/calcium exchanger)